MMPADFAVQNGPPPSAAGLLAVRRSAVARSLHRGRGVVVQGSLESARWEAGEGPEYEAAFVLAEGVYFVDSITDRRAH
jgi:single-stranded DNA-binding protein